MTYKEKAAGLSQEGIEVHLSREDVLLVYCARIELSGERRQAVKDFLTEGVDWDYLLEKAAWHRLSPLVSHHLQSPDLSVFVPGSVLERLQRLKYQSLARNMFLQDELFRLLAAFNGKGITVIVLKGAALLGTIYRDINLRPMSDIDILVQPENLDRAEAIAMRLGYEYIADRDTQEQIRRNGRHLANLMHRKKGIVLEIHHHIVNLDDPYHFDVSSFWDRARPITVSGVDALSLAPEDMLIHLSINFLLDRRYHSTSALGQLCDISEVIQQHGDSLDWDLIEEVAQRHCIASGLHCVFYACEQLLHTRVPASILQKFQPREFNAALTNLFLRRRVLDAKSWLAHGLVDSKIPYSRHRALAAIAGRFSRVVSEIFRKDGDQTGTGSFRLRRIKDILPRLGRVLLRPSELKEDLMLDRWLHDLYGSNTRLHDGRRIIKDANIWPTSK